MPATLDAVAKFQALSPAIQWHLVTALAALALGPLALWARKGSTLHKRAGYAWIVLMLSTATFSLFIRDFHLPNIAGYTPIHLFTVFTFVGIAGAIWAVMRGNISAHRKGMRQVYIGGCVVAGLFTLLPGRFMGQMLWGQVLGLV